MAQTSSVVEQIDGHKYEIHKLPPKVARRLLVEMAKVLGPVLGQVLETTNGKISTLMDLDLSSIKWTSLVGELTQRVDDHMLDDHMSVLAKVTLVNNQPLDGVFDRHFQGDLGGMFKWYGAALKVNFGNFTSALESASALLPVQPKAPV